MWKAPEKSLALDQQRPGPGRKYGPSGLDCALQLSRTHDDITFICLQGCASAWARYILERGRMKYALIDNDVRIDTNRTVTAFTDSGVKSGCLYGGKSVTYPCDLLILITERCPWGDLATNGERA